MIVDRREIDARRGDDVAQRDVAGIIERIVAVSVLALRGSEAAKQPLAKLAARDAR